MPKNKFYLTTSIVYTNGPPHIGFTLELVQADALVRYHKLTGDETYFLTGSDEHGFKNQRSAKEAGKEPQEFVDSVVKHYTKLTDELNISNDQFIRTSDQDLHWPGVIQLWNKLVEAGAIEKQSYTGLYCEGHEAFMQESDLVDGLCPDHQKAPKEVSEENYFFTLSKYKDWLKDQIENEKIKIVPARRKNEMLELIKDLQDVSFSRPSDSLSWGVPVPGDDTQTMYVWADALTNYISAIGYGRDEDSFKKLWPANVQIIGKDILRFHSLIWPAMLHVVGEETPKTLFVHGHVTSEGKKMSKTIGNVIDPFEYIEEWGSEALRYYLLRKISPIDDGDFSRTDFETTYKADLVDGLSNLVHRTLSLVKGDEILIQKGGPLMDEISNAYQAVSDHMLEFRFDHSLAAIWELVAVGNKYLEETQPWKLEDKGAQHEIYGNLLGLISIVGTLIQPFLPETSEKLFKLLNTDQLNLESSPIDQFSNSITPSSNPTPLFLKNR